MKSTVLLHERITHLFGAAAGTLALIVGALIYPANHYLTAAILVLSAVVLYFYISFVPAKKNWWDIRAVFSAVWLVTTGLAALRLTDYQVAWETMTWVCMTFAFLMFHLGVLVGDSLGKKLYVWTQRKLKHAFGTIKLELQEGRLFWICFWVMLVGLGCFLANVAIRGYIPYFTTGGTAYYDFYTKFHVFAVAATMVSGPCYYTLKMQKLNVWKKLFLWFSILYSTFGFPMLIVSRGTFLVSALSLTTFVFYLNKKRLIALVLCAVVIVAFYAEGTSARGYSEDQLNEFFEPSQITMSGGENASDTVSPGPTDEIQQTPQPTPGPTDEIQQTPQPTPGPTDEIQKIPQEAPGGFQLSGTAAFIYSYLTVSHDNFNAAVSNLQNFSYGLRELTPFNVILRIDAIDEALSHSEVYLVRDHLNSLNLIGHAYYDFGIIGVVLMSFIWAVAFGMMQSYYTLSKGIFSLWALGCAMTPVALCFFDPWMSNFTQWMNWGLVFLMFIAACISIHLPRKQPQTIS